MNVRYYSTRTATQQIYCTQKFTIFVSDNTLIYIKRSHEYKKGAQILTIHPFLYKTTNKHLKLLIEFLKRVLELLEDFCGRGSVKG